MNKTERIINEIDSLIDKAEKIALTHLEELIVSDMKRRTTVKSFYMGMGTYFYTNKVGDNFDVPKNIDDYIINLDILKLSGSQMKIERIKNKIKRIK